jgi:hypothetical protein
MIFLMVADPYGIRYLREIFCIPPLEPLVYVGVMLTRITPYLTTLMKLPGADVI